MDEDKDTRPLLSYEEVIEIIDECISRDEPIARDERIARMEKAAARMACSGLLRDSGQSCIGVFGRVKVNRDEMNGNKDGRIMANKDIQKEIRSLDDTAQFTLSTRQMAEYCQRIVAYLETEKRYREPGYSLWELSRDTGISTKIISKSINGYMGRNFYDLINRMRIEEAKKMLREMAVTNSRLMIEEVGVQCGFRSRSVFFTRFNGYEKMTPRKYMSMFEKKREGDAERIKRRNG